MDSIPNIPLLDEDDSFLFNDSAAATADVFSCSPLIPLRSNPPQTEGGAADSENRSSSVNDSANKENADWNKPQKLSLEPQQMKRKKKGGGYNLRKSLAWNRAFFTEEGVLNPVELSMISGTASAKAGLDLEVIHEEEYVGTSTKLQEIEQNLFMYSSDALPVEDRKVGATARFSPKFATSAKASPASVSLAKRKMLIVNDSVGNRPKRNACPPRLPVASSSPDTVKAPSKEVKVPRTPGPKLDVSASATTARRGILNAGFSKRNQNAHPATNINKQAAVKTLSRNPKTVPSNPKVGPADKRPVTRTLAKRAGKLLDNSVSETHPPPRMLQSGTEANKVPEACLPQSVSDIDEKKQQTQLQTTKMSGLRMPSPSLGFFSMAKAPTSSHGQLQKISKPCKPTKSNIPKLQNLETTSVNDTRLQRAPGIRSEIVKGVAKNCTEGLSLLDVKLELGMQVDDKQMAGVEVAYNSAGSENISRQEKVENILEHVIIKSKEQGELHRSEKKLLSESHTQEQLEKEADQPDVLSNNNQSVLQEPRSMHYHGIQRTPIVKGSISNTVHCMGQDENEQTKVLSCDVLTSNESLALPATHSTSLKDRKLSGQFNEHNSVKTAIINSSLIDFSEIALEGSMQEIPYERNTEQVNGGAADFVKSGGDAQEHLLNENLSDNCNESTESNLKAVNEQLQGEQLKTASASMVDEIMSTKESECHVNSCQLVHMTTLSSKCSPQKSILEIKCAAANEPKIAKIEDCQLSVDDQSGFIQTISVSGQCDKVIDSKAMDHSTQVFELDRLSEDCITVSTTCNTKVSYVSQESRPFHENNVQNLHLKSQVCPVVKADFVSSENEMSSNNCCTISELQLRDEDSSIHYDVACDVPGIFEQQNSKITCSKASTMLGEDESLVLNNGHLLDQSEFSDISADIISNSKDSIGSGAENSSSCLQHTLLTRLVREVDLTNREIEESHVEYAQMELLNENPVSYKCNSADSENCNNILHSDSDWLPTNIDSSEETKKVVEDVQVRSFKENPAPVSCNSKHCLVANDTDFQRPGAFGTADSDNVNNILLHLNGDRLPTNVAPSEEIKKSNLFEDASCDIYTSEHNASNNHIHAMPENKDGNLRMDDLQSDDPKEGYSDILPIVEFQLNDNIQAMSENKDGNLNKNDLHMGDAQASSDILPLVEVQLNDNIQARSENIERNLDMDDAKEGSSDIFPLVKIQVNDNIQAMSENNDGNLDMDDAKEGSSDILPLTEVQLIDNIQDNSDNEDGNLDMDEANECSSDILSLVEIQPIDNIQAISENRDGTLASMNYHVHSDVPENIEEQTKADKMLCEYESLELNHDHLVDQSEFSEVSAAFISNTKDSISSGAEKPSGCLQDTLLPQFVQEFNHTNREIEESCLTTQVQSLTENPVAYNCNSKQCLAVSDDKFPLVDNDNINKNSHLSDFQGRCSVGVDSQNVDNIQHLDGDCLSTNIASSEEIKKTKLSQHALEGCNNIHTGEHNASSNDHIQAMPENKDGNLYADEKAEHLQMDDTKNGSSDMLPFVEVQLNDNVVSSECNYFIEESKDSFTDVVAWKPEEHCSSESSSLPALDNLTSNTGIPQVCEISLLNTKSFSEEAGTNILEKDESPKTDMEHQSKGGIYFAEDGNKLIDLQESATKSKQEVLTVKPPPNAAPFSDEWLAAIEAAGEEILTKKSGAVQNSPTDKPQHEPGPWSPVKRKNQWIGPFDCTKHNIQHSSP